MAEPVSQLMTGASSGFQHSTFITSKIPGTFGHYTNSTIEAATFQASQAASAVIGTAPAPVEVSSSRRLVSGGVVGTAAIPVAPFSVPTQGPYTVTLKETSASEKKDTAHESATINPTAKASKESAHAKPTPSCTMLHNQHFGTCVLKDIVSKSKVTGTNALVTGTAFRKIYDAICDCKRVHNVSENATMPEPVEVCGVLMCPNQGPEAKRQPGLARTEAVSQGESYVASSSKHQESATKQAEQPTIFGTAAANGAGTATSSRPCESTEAKTAEAHGTGVVKPHESSHVHGTAALHAAATGRVPVHGGPSKFANEAHGSGIVKHHESGHAHGSAEVHAAATGRIPVHGGPSKFAEATWRYAGSWPSTMLTSLVSIADAPPPSLATEKA